jgi:Tol biopolymer transport system component
MGKYEMRSMILTLTFLVCCSPLNAAIPVPDRAITDPSRITSPENPHASPVPIEDLAISRGLFDAAWSVDGKQVFVSTNLTGRYNIWRVESEGSWPVQLTVSDDAQSGLSPSPDGRTLLFTQDVGGNEYSDVYAVPTLGGSVVQLTNTPDITENNPRFSPDGRSISLEIKPKSGTVANVAIMNLATRQVRQLTDEKISDRNWQVVGWMPDGKSLIANRVRIDFSEGGIWRIDIASGHAEPILEEQPKIVVIATISSNEATGQMRAGVYDLSRRTFRWFKPTPWEQFSGQFAPDGRTLVLRTGEDGRSTLSLADVVTGNEQVLAFPPGVQHRSDIANAPIRYRFAALASNSQRGKCTLRLMDRRDR